MPLALRSPVDPPQDVICVYPCSESITVLVCSYNHKSGKQKTDSGFTTGGEACTRSVRSVYVWPGHVAACLYPPVRLTLAVINVNPTFGVGLSEGRASYFFSISSICPALGKYTIYTLNNTRKGVYFWRWKDDFSLTRKGMKVEEERNDRTLVTCSVGWMHSNYDQLSELYLTTNIRVFAYMVDRIGFRLKSRGTSTPSSAQWTGNKCFTAFYQRDVFKKFTRTTRYYCKSSCTLFIQRTQIVMLHQDYTSIGATILDVRLVANARIRLNVRGGGILWCGRFGDWRVLCLQLSSSPGGGGRRLPYHLQPLPQLDSSCLILILLARHPVVRTYRYCYRSTLSTAAATATATWRPGSPLYPLFIVSVIAFHSYRGKNVHYSQACQCGRIGLRLALGAGIYGNTRKFLTKCSTRVRIGTLNVGNS
ncbi:hypothetical protein J6590_029436 [Homalodisca vitripennis]|nr:hypothetical protein J6590_029436 [Homalodisca vitripennis]